MKELVNTSSLNVFLLTKTIPTEILEQDAKNFNRLGGDLKKKMWWKNFKVSSHAPNSCSPQKEKLQLGTLICST